VVPLTHIHAYIYNENIVAGIREHSVLKHVAHVDIAMMSRAQLANMAYGRGEAEGQRLIGSCHAMLPYADTTALGHTLYIITQTWSTCVL